MRAYWVIGFAITAGTIVRAADCTLTVYVHSSPQSGKILWQAEAAASEMFREIVTVQWRSGVVRADAADNGCGIPIEVQIETGPDGAKVGEDALAYATLFGKSGTCIHVFLDRVMRYRTVDMATIVLAHVLVHELTHAIEQVNRHSAEGVMKATWTYEDYRIMKSGRRLAFAPIDVELIHIGIAKRAQQAVSE